MLALTKKTDHALIALACLAKRFETSAHGQSPCVCAREIADAFDLPLPQLMNILKELVRAKIIRSLRGACGGYVLARSPKQVTLLEVITAMEGPVRLTECCSGALPILGQGCVMAKGCPVRRPISRLHGRIQDFFASVTLAQLLESSPADAQEMVLSSQVNWRSPSAAQAMA